MAPWALCHHQVPINNMATRFPPKVGGSLLNLGGHSVIQLIIGKIRKYGVETGIPGTASPSLV